MKKRYNISIEEEVKLAFDAEVARMGLSASSAIEIFMRAVAGQHCIPFPIGSYDNAPATDDSKPEPEAASGAEPKTEPEPERKSERSGKKGKGKKKK